MWPLAVVLQKNQRMKEPSQGQRGQSLGLDRGIVGGCTGLTTRGPILVAHESESGEPLIALGWERAI